MPEFSNLADLERYLNQKISKALETTVSEEAKKTMSEHVEIDVYDRYNPTSYERTGALADESNIQTTMINDNTLEIENVRKDEETGRLVAPVIESGKGYEWGYNRNLNEVIGERPFIQETAKDLASGKALAALAEGLKKQGLDVI
jgi:hypothetical protein